MNKRNDMMKFLLTDTEAEFKKNIALPSNRDYKHLLQNLIIQVILRVAY